VENGVRWVRVGASQRSGHAHPYLPEGVPRLKLTKKQTYLSKCTKHNLIRKISVSTIPTFFRLGNMPGYGEEFNFPVGEGVYFRGSLFYSPHNFYLKILSENGIFLHCFKHADTSLKAVDLKELQSAVHMFCSLSYCSKNSWVLYVCKLLWSLGSRGHGADATDC